MTGLLIIMMNIDSIIGDIIFISFHDIEQYHEIGLTDKNKHFKLVGYDQVGLWLTHPGLIVTNSKDTVNTIKNKSKNNIEDIVAEFVVVWGNIKTIMHYPDRKNYDLPSEYDKNIGFKLKK